MAEEDIDEIVRWQMTGVLTKKTPVARRAPNPRCQHCGDDWHGLPTTSGCPGSHVEMLENTPESDMHPITDSDLG